MAELISVGGVNQADSIQLPHSISMITNCVATNYVLSRLTNREKKHQWKRDIGRKG